AAESDPMKFIDNFMPDGLRDQMKAGLKMYQNRRETVIKEIAANSKFTEDRLKTMSDEDLAALHETLCQSNGDESGNYAPLTSTYNSDEDKGSQDEIGAMLSFASSKPVEKEKETK